MYVIFVAINKTYNIQKFKIIRSALHGHEDKIMSKNLDFFSFFEFFPIFRNQGTLKV